jgi:hypothetical protein
MEQFFWDLFKTVIISCEMVILIRRYHTFQPFNATTLIIINLVVLLTLVLLNNIKTNIT